MYPFQFLEIIRIYLSISEKLGPSKGFIFLKYIVPKGLCPVCVSVVETREKHMQKGPNLT